MPNIQIYQGQSVNFSDTSYGGIKPYSYLWSFSGGSITSATGPTANVSYNSPGNYTVSLRVTDATTLSDVLTITGLVGVDPAEINANFSQSATTISMNSPISFTDSSTGTPDAPTSWSWLVGSSSYTTQNVSNYQYSDWASIPGANLAALPGSSVTVNVTLTASNSLTSGNKTKTFNVRKQGPVETFYVNWDKPTPVGNYLQESPVTYVGRASSLGLPGNNPVYQTMPGNIGSMNQPINYFHSNLESLQIACTGFSTPHFLDYGAGIASNNSGYLAVNGLLYGGIPSTTTSGQYITSGSTDELFFVIPDELATLVNSYNYSEDMVAEIIGNQYPLIHSAQSINLLNYKFPTFLSKTANPVVPSPTYFASLGIPGGTATNFLSATFRVYYYTYGLQAFTVDFNANSGVGNIIPGDFYSMQSTGGGDGVVDMINAAINSSLPGGTSDLEATASSGFSVDPGATPSTYNGIKIEIKTTDIASVRITDNSSMLGPLAQAYGGQCLPFACNNTAPPVTGTSCSGMLSYIDLDSSQYIAQGGTWIQVGGGVV